jgi:hypothetical protein
MNSLHNFISAYALCSLFLFILIVEPKKGGVDFVVSAIVAIIWPLWVLVQLF